MQWTPRQWFAIQTGSGGGGTPPPTEQTLLLALDPVRWSTRPRDFEDGTAGSSARGFYMLAGDDSYLYETHAADTPAGVVQTGYDPGDFEAALSGRTGFVVAHPAGHRTAEQRAQSWATVLATIPGITSAAAAVSANDDGSWNVSTLTGLTLATGTRVWASRGAAGLHGSHLYRLPRAGEITGSTDIAIGRLVATRVNIPNSADIVWAVQMCHGGTVTAGAQRPRLQYRASTSNTSPATTPEDVFDFGQIPVSQMTAGDVGTIFLTPTQTLAMRTALDGVSGTAHWLSVHSAGSVTNYNGVPNGGGYDGETAGGQVAVATAGSEDATSAQTFTTLSASFSFIVPLRLVVERDPCTTGEQQAVWGGFAPYATYPSDVVLPDSVTAQRADIDDMDRMRLLAQNTSTVAGLMRFQTATGGGHTPDTPVMAGAVTLWDAGVNEETGAGSIDAPTGAATIRIPAGLPGLWVMFKGFGATGRGEVGPGPFTITGRPDQPSDWIRRFGANIGLNPGELDMAATGLGDDSVVFESPIVARTTSQPDNHPSSRATFQLAAVTITAA